jgi:hypothetical protein
MIFGIKVREVTTQELKCYMGIPNFILSYYNQDATASVV